MKQSLSIFIQRAESQSHDFCRSQLILIVIDDCRLVSEVNRLSLTFFSSFQLPEPNYKNINHASTIRGRTQLPIFMNQTEEMHQNIRFIKKGIQLMDVWLGMMQYHCSRDSVKPWIDKHSDLLQKPVLIQQKTLKRTKATQLQHSLGLWSMLCSSRWGEPNWTQVSRQQQHSSPAGYIITHPDGAATWYALHTY